MVTIVRMDSPEGGIASLAQKATQWLLEEGVIQPNSKEGRALAAQRVDAGTTVA